jgi:hypothetical protein
MFGFISSIRVLPFGLNYIYKKKKPILGYTYAIHSFWKISISIPCIITTFWIIIYIIKQSTEIDKNGPWNVRGNLVGLHLLRRSKRRNCN